VYHVQTVDSSMLNYRQTFLARPSCIFITLNPINDGTEILLKPIIIQYTHTKVPFVTKWLN